MRLMSALGTVCVLVLAASAQAQAPPAGQQNRQGQAQVTQTTVFPTPLYRMDDISRSMNLRPEQINRLNTLTTQIQERYRTQFDQLGRLAERERFSRSTELNQQYNQAWMTGARDIFNQEQLNRYQQLHLQHGGFNTFLDPEVQKRLDLTEAQRKDLQSSIDWSRQQLEEITRQGRTDRNRGMELYRDYRKQFQTRFDKFLTPEQQKTWREMIGEPYEFQPTYLWPTPQQRNP